MNYTLNNIAGYEMEKRELERLCEVIQKRDKYSELGARLPKGIIFYGPTGAGKTLFAKVLASVCGLKTYSIELGNAHKERSINRQIKSTFMKAKRSKNPTMIFFDELDKVLPNDYEEYYTDSSKGILAQLLTLIDDLGDNGKTIFVGTCNDYQSLHEALVRPGRIDKKIALKNPDYNSRLQIIDYYTNRVGCEFSLLPTEIAERTTGFSCAALETLVNECVLRSVGEVINEKEVTAVIREIRNESIDVEIDANTKKIFASRNIGSLLVARTFNQGPYLLNLELETVSNDYYNNLLSYFDSEYDGNCCDNYEGERGVYVGKEEYLNLLCVLFGGVCGEELVLNSKHDSLCENFARVDDILIKMSESGMFGLEYYYSSERNEEMKYSCERLAKIDEKFEEIKLEAYKKAKEILLRNRRLLDLLVPILMERECMTDKQCENIIKELSCSNVNE